MSHKGETFCFLQCSCLLYSQIILNADPKPPLKRNTWDIWSCSRPQGIWHVRSPDQAVDLGLSFSVCVLLLSCVRVFATPWTVTHQAPPSMEFSRQGYWSGLLFPTPGDLPNPGTKPESLASPAFVCWFFTIAPLGKPACSVQESILHTGHFLSKVQPLHCWHWWPCCPLGAASSEEGVQVWITSLHLSHCSSAWCWVCPVGPGTLSFLTVRWWWWWWWWYMLCLPPGLVVKVSCVRATFINCKLLFETWASVNKSNRAGSVCFFPDSAAHHDHFLRT